MFYLYDNIVWRTIKDFQNLLSRKEHSDVCHRATVFWATSEEPAPQRQA